MATFNLSACVELLNVNPVRFALEVAPNLTKGQHKQIAEAKAKADSDAVAGKARKALIRQLNPGTPDKVVDEIIGHFSAVATLIGTHGKPAGDKAGSGWSGMAVNGFPVSPSQSLKVLLSDVKAK